MDIYVHVAFVPCLGANILLFFTRSPVARSNYVDLGKLKKDNCTIWTIFTIQSIQNETQPVNTTCIK